ncbi:MAG: hypothetical protein GXC76_13160 [Rhodanobacteraceae bacterium]|jgi:hypothetical protein|nr:hypothetical protein [Rhodanobacteraceae bacterium]
MAHAPDDQPPARGREHVVRKQTVRAGRIARERQHRHVVAEPPREFRVLLAHARRIDAAGRIHVAVVSRRLGRQHVGGRTDQERRARGRRGALRKALGRERGEEGGGIGDEHVVYGKRRVVDIVQTQCRASSQRRLGGAGWAERSDAQRVCTCIEDPLL